MCCCGRHSEGLKSEVDMMKMIKGSEYNFKQRPFREKLTEKGRKQKKIES